MDNFAQDFASYSQNGESAALRERRDSIRRGRDSFWEYCKLINPEFFRDSRLYQKNVCDTLQAFYENGLMNGATGKPCDIMILNLPPGFGKSYTASLFATWIYGKNVKNQVIAVAYSQMLTIQFSKTVRDLITDTDIQGDYDYYCVNSFFPKVKIKFGDAAMERWSLEGYYNSYLATSFDGGITGMRGSFLIIDDPIRSAEEALNERVKNKHWDFYKNTFTSRILDGGKQLIIQTRWATDDLTGKLLAEHPDRCHVLRLTALDDSGKSICEDLYSTEGLLTKRATIDESIWSANFEQEPIDLQGALYGVFKTHSLTPDDKDAFERIIAYVDTADTGADFLCAISAGIIGEYVYVLDVYYADAPMEVTEPETARRLSLNNVRECVIESNNGGRGFARNVEAKLKATGNKKCIVTWFTQSKNKNTRIKVNAGSVTDKVIMPDNWEKIYPEFYKAVAAFQRKGKNEHDDAPDALTGLYELFVGEVKGVQRGKILNRRKFGGLF